MGWDGKKAEKQIHEWASDDKDKPIKAKASKCYLKVEDPGDLWGNYSYPFCYIEDDKPAPQEDALPAAWGYAKSNDTDLLRIILGKMKANKFKLTPAMQDWAKKNMSKGSIAPLSTIIKREDGHIFVNGVAQEQGVFNGGLKLASEFFPDTPNMIGVDIIRGEHPTDEDGTFIPHSEKDQIIGRIIDAVNVPEKNHTMAIWDFDEKMLTEDEIKDVLAGKPPFGTSPGYWCGKEILPTPRLWEDGTPYSFIERKSFLYDHFATPKKPACKRCGPLHINSKTGGDSITKQRKPEEIKEASDKLTMEGEPSFMVNQALDETVLQNEIIDVLDCGDDFQSGIKAKKLLVQILKTILGANAGTLSTMSEHKPKEIDMGKEKMLPEDEARLRENIKLMVNEEVQPVRDALSTAEKTIASQATEITQLKTAEQTRIDNEKKATDAAVATAEENTKKDFFAHLKPGIAKTEEEKKTLWESVKANIGGWIFANPDKVVLTANSEQPKYTPKGLPVVPALQANSAEERDQKYREMGITPASELTKMWDKKGV